MKSEAVHSIKSCKEEDQNNFYLPAADTLWNFGGVVANPAEQQGTLVQLEVD